MRSFIAYLLLFAVMLPTLTPWGTIAYFNSNRAYITKVLCENRSKPMLNCNGKCYLAKKLKKQQDKADKETSQKVEHTAVANLFFLSFPRIVFKQSFVLKKRINFTYSLNPYLTTLGGLLKPPRLS